MLMSVGASEILLDPTIYGILLSAAPNNYISIGNTVDPSILLNSTGTIQASTTDRIQLNGGQSVGIGGYDSAATPPVYLCGQYNNQFALKVSVTGNAGQGLGDTSLITNSNAILIRSINNNALSNVALQAGSSALSVGATSGVVLTSATGGISLNSSYTNVPIYFDGSSGNNTALALTLSATGGYGLGDVTNLATNNKILIASSLNTSASKVTLQSGTSSVSVGATNGIRMSSSPYSIVLDDLDNGMFLSGAASGNTDFISLYGPNSPEIGDPRIYLNSTGDITILATSGIRLQTSADINVGYYKGELVPVATVYICGDPSKHVLKMTTPTATTNTYGLGDISELTTNNKILIKSNLNTANSNVSLQSGTSVLSVGATTGIQIAPAGNQFVTSGRAGATSAASAWMCVGPGVTQNTPAAPIIGTMIVGTDGNVYIWAGSTPAWQLLSMTPSSPPAPV